MLCKVPRCRDEATHAMLKRLLLMIDPASGTPTFESFRNAAKEHVFVIEVLHLCAMTGLTPCHICTRTGLAPTAKESAVMIGMRRSGNTPKCEWPKRECA